MKRVTVLFRNNATPPMIVDCEAVRIGETQVKFDLPPGTDANVSAATEDVAAIERRELHYNEAAKEWGVLPVAVPPGDFFDVRVYLRGFDKPIRFPAKNVEVANDGQAYIFDYFDENVELVALKMEEVSAFQSVPTKYDPEAVVGGQTGGLTEVTA